MLNDIFNRLEHVKVDSFVNARIVDDAGLLPIPSTELTGLLVSAYAAPGVQEVHVTNPTIAVTGDVGLAAGAAVIVSGAVDVVTMPADTAVHLTSPITGSVSVANIPHVVVDNNVAMHGIVDTTIVGPSPLLTTIVNTPHVVVDNDVLVHGDIMVTSSSPLDVTITGPNPLPVEVTNTYVQHVIVDNVLTAKMMALTLTGEQAQVCGAVPTPLAISDEDGLRYLTPGGASLLSLPVGYNLVEPNMQMAGNYISGSYGSGSTYIGSITRPPPT